MTDKNDVLFYASSRRFLSSMIKRQVFIRDGLKGMSVLVGGENSHLDILTKKLPLLYPKEMQLKLLPQSPCDYRDSLFVAF